VTATLAEIEDNLSVRVAGVRNLIQQPGGWNMKAYKLALIGVLFLVAVTTMQAQNSLPDAHDNSCWSSASALQACQLQADQKADQQVQDYQYRCTSYPEYQCNDYYQPPQKKIAAKSARPVTAPANTQTSAADSATVQDASARGNTR
jgi:hypothetical protein